MSAPTKESLLALVTAALDDALAAIHDHDLTRAIERHGEAKQMLGGVVGVFGVFPGTAFASTAARAVLDEIKAAVARPVPTLDEVTDAIAHGIAVLRTRDGIAAVTDELALERARNVVVALSGIGALR